MTTVPDTWDDALIELEGGPEVPRRLGGVPTRDLQVAGGCAASAVALVWLLQQLTPPLGGAGSFFLAYLLFLVLLRGVLRDADGPVLGQDRFMAVVVGSAAFMMVVPLCLIVGFVVVKGVHALTWHFFTETQQFVGPQSSATEGGAAHAIIGTLEQVGLAVLISVPLGFASAVFLNEVGGRLGRPTRILVDAMSGVPTIVAGLFVYSAWVLRFGFSGFAATLAISISMLPVITRTAEEVLRLVPNGLREASLALGISEWRTVRGVVLPTARSGLVTSIILGVGRAIGETAPLIMTAFGASVMNSNPFHGAQASLPLFIYKQITESSQENVQARAWTGAFVLLLVVLFTFALARVLSNRMGRPRRRRRRSIVERDN